MSADAVAQFVVAAVSQANFAAYAIATYAKRKKHVQHTKNSGKE